MARSDDPRQRYDDARDRIDADRDDPISERDADAILSVLDGLDPMNPTAGTGDGVSNNTLGVYAERLRLFAHAVEYELATADADDVAGTMVALRDGDPDVAPDDGYAKSTLRQYRAALGTFYRYHDDHGVDPDEIPVPETDNGAGKAVDPRDMFGTEEVEALRDATTDERERALLELLIYTGQRLRVIQQLTIRDVDEKDGWLYVPDVDGTKGASGKRPLLGAREYVRRWLDYHPCPDDPDAALLTAKPEHGGGGEPGEPLSASTLRYHLKKLADRADIENVASDGGNRVRPHMFRHYFTTVAKRDFGLDDAYIKRLRGDAPDSNVMETTYQHLTDEDAAEAARAAAEGREPETPGEALTRDLCSTCGELLPEGAKACPACGELYAPDAEAAKEQLERDMFDRAAEAEPGSEAADDVEAFKEAMQNDPEFAAEVAEAAAEALRGDDDE